LQEANARRIAELEDKLAHGEPQGGLRRQSDRTAEKNVLSHLNGYANRQGFAGGRQ
jgi:hypothetical protein